MSDKTTAGRMADAADADLGLPYSLILDAWDRLDATVDLYFSRYQFEDMLVEALTEYEANPRGYRFNERAVLVYASTPVEAASISEAVIGVPADELAAATSAEGLFQPAWRNS